MTIDTAIILLLFVAFLGAGYAIVSGIWHIVAQRGLMARRLSQTSGPAGQRHIGTLGPNTLINDDGALRKFESLVSPKDTKALTEIRQKMMRAGRRNGAAVRWFYLQKGAYGLGFALLGLIYGVLFLAEVSPIILIAVVMGMTVMGMMVPTFLLSRAIQHRQDAVRAGFPDAVDMLLVCVEAGMGLDQALARLADELERSQPVLADEFTLVCAELRAGKARDQVLRDLADRTGLDDVAALVTVLNQSVDFGVSIASSLRVFSSEMRYKRITRAEEKANAMPMKLAMGSVLFTIPPVGILLAGPSVIMMLRSFASF